VTTDQMGPQRFGAKGKLAFTMGGTAQDEGSADAEYAFSRGWKTAPSARSRPGRSRSCRRSGRRSSASS